ncbi:MAG: mannitol dehydrogenase family protein [Aliihoeflea sp.]
MAAQRLTALHAITGTARLPAYVPTDHGVGIVHLGLGAFHRAHQAVATDDALAAKGGDWRIIPVSLRSREAGAALNPQNGLYTLIERGSDGTSGRIIGSLTDAIAADPAATLKALCNPAVRIVTLTVTEKGYGIDRDTLGPDWNNEAVAADRKNPDAPIGVLGLLTAAIKARRGAGLVPLTILSCDNLPENGALLRSGVVGFARALDEELADFIEREISFPSSMVDRITPAATAETLADAERLTGLSDLAAIETEAFTQWVIEDRFPHGRPHWEAGGAIFVDEVAPYERMKLTMLNGTHSMLAYAGFMSGHAHVRDVMGDPMLATLVKRHLQTAALDVGELPGIDLSAYAEDLARRFTNPAIAHATYQIAMDGTEKLPQRIFAPALVALRAGRDLRAYAFATAAWMRYALGTDDAGNAYALRDPKEEAIAANLADAGRDAARIVTALSSLPGFLPPELSGSEQWRAAVESRLGVMLEYGMREAVQREVAE